MPAIHPGQPVVILFRHELPPGTLTAEEQPPEGLDLEHPPEGLDWLEG